LCLAIGSTATAGSQGSLGATDASITTRATNETRQQIAFNAKKLRLRSKSALVLDRNNREIYSKNADEARPIASITKLMTAIVVLDAGLSLDEPIKVTKDDRDLLRMTGSRLKVGATLPRGDMLRIALMASENRAASALCRTYPGGTDACVDAMNRRAGQLGMTKTRFVDGTGLGAGNVSSARDLGRMVRAALGYPLIQEATTTRSLHVRPWKNRGPLRYGNTNRLLKNENWDIELSKTGYINEAGRCLVMRADGGDGPLTIVLLNSFGKLTPFGDSNRIRKWIGASYPPLADRG
jgi:D-alanyl-D-alanine endopeptidase (penicillin-binding protein 7)